MDFLRKAYSKLLTAVGGTAPPGEEIQVLIPKEDGSYDMDKVALKNLAEHPDVIHNPVAVISIAGAMREGKSFLLSLLVMYLESNLDSRWLDKPDTPIPFNFKWKGGILPETRGVWIWSKPYLVKKRNGTKIALLLMDTQGCFDKSGARNDSNIFTFSTLLSSVQIYNLKDQIKENHLQPLAVFIDYAKESMKKMQSIQCFQNLLFLIRDWIDEDNFPFGKEGGDKYLEQEAFHYEGNDPDIIMVRDKIRETFTSANCVLLPHPGKVIAKGKPKKPGTSICVKDMDDEFRDEIHHFLRFLIDDFTIPLKVGQKDIVGEELLNFTSKLFDLLQTNDIENPASAMEGISLAKGQTLMQRILREYDTTMETAIKSKCKDSVLTRKHEEAQQKALQDYDKDSAALHKNHKEPYKERLEKEIKYIFLKHLGTWKANQTILHLQYNEKLLEIIRNYERLLKEEDPSAKEKVNEDFCEFFSGKPHYHQYEEKLKSRMNITENKNEKKKEIHKRKEEERGTKIIEHLQQQYNTWMDDLGYCTKVGLKTSHERFQSNILRNYEKHFKTRYDHLHHELRMRLVEMLEQSFRNYQHKRLEKENTLRKEYEELVNKTLNNYKKDLEDGKENAKENALTCFYENKPADDTYYKEYYEKLDANMKKFHSHFENQQRLKKISEESKGKEIVERLHKRYNAFMDKDSICKDEEFKKKDNAIRAKILRDFDKEFTTSFKHLQKEFKEKLMGNLQESSVSKKQALDVEKNKLRDKYEKLLEDVLANYKGYLQKRNPKAVELAMIEYEKQRPDDKYFNEVYFDKLDKKMEKVFNEYKKNKEFVKLSSRNLVYSICKEYEKSMKDAVERNYYTESDFPKIHDKHEKQALTQFDERLKYPQYFDDIKSSSRNELKEKIAEIFVDCSNNRQRKENTLRKEYEELVNKTLNDYKKDLEDGKENAKENALTSFYENKPADDSYYKEYYEKLEVNMKDFQDYFENQQQLKKISEELKGKEVVERLHKRYNAKMDKGSICKDEEFKKKENNIRTKILHDFDEEFTTSFEDLRKEFKEKLMGNLQESSVSKKQALDVEKNKLRNQYEKLLEAVLANYKGYLQKRHPKANELAMIENEKQRPDDKYFYEEYSDKLDKKMIKILNEYKKNEELVELTSRKLVFSICAEYEKSMKDAVEKDYSTESDFQKIHDKHKKQALTQFDEELICPEYFDDIKNSLRKKLKEKIAEIFVDCSNNRQRKENTLRKKYKELVNKTLNDYKKDLEDGKENAKEKALTSFYENKLADDSYYKEYYETLEANMKNFQDYFENQQQLKKISDESKGKDIVERLHKRYNALMDKGSICKDEEFKRKENNIRTQILHDFDEEFTTPFKDLQKEFKEMLMENLQESSVSKKQALDVEKNKLRNQYEKLLEAVLTNYKGYLQKRHPKANELANIDYKKQRPDDKYFNEEYSDKLDKKRKKIFNEYKKNEEFVELSSRNLVFSICAEYEKSMKDAVERNYYTESYFQQIHDKYEKQALVQFDERLECPEHFDDIKSSSRNELKEKIGEIFVDCSNNRQRKENTLRKEYEELVKKTLNNYKKDLEDGKENAKENALTCFYENKPDDDTYYKEYYETLEVNMKDFQDHFENQQQLKKISDESKGKEIVERLHKRYNAFMNEFGICTDEQFKRKENNIRTKILQDFDKEFTTSFKDLQKEIKEKLMGNLQESFVFKKQALDVEKNKLRDQYEKLLEVVLANYKGYLQKRHLKAVERAMTDYKKQSPDDKYFYEQYSDKLDKEMEKVFKEYKKNEELVELSSRNLVFSISAEYEASMKDAVEKNYYTKLDFQKIRDKYEKQALAQFDEKLNCPKHFDDIKSSSRNELKEKIEEIFVGCSNNRQRKENTLRKKYEELVNKTLNNYKKDLEDGKENAKENASTSFYENKPADDSYYKEYYEKLVANMKNFQDYFENQQRLKKMSDELKGKEVVERLHKRYNAFMDQGSICKDEEFKKKDNNIRTKILQDFDKEFTTSFKDLQKEIKEKLMGNLQESSVFKKQALDVEKNKLRDQYEKLLEAVLANYKGYLQKRHPKAVELAMTDYKKQSPDDKYFYEQYSDKLDKEMEKVFKEYKKNEELVELSSRNLVFSISAEYEASMKDAVEKNYYTKLDFQQIHGKYEEQALAKFDKRLNCPEYFDDIKSSSRNKLKEKIEEIFVDCSNNRQRKEDHLRSQYNSAVDEAVNEYTKCLQGSNDEAVEQAKSYFEKRSVNFDKFLCDESDEKLNTKLKNNQQKREGFIQSELENIAQTALKKYQQLMEKEIFPQGNKPKVFPKTKMKIFHDQYKDEAMVDFATASDGIGEKENLKCRKNICKQSIDEKFEEYSAQQEDHRKELEEFEVEAVNEYRKYMGDVAGNCYMEPHVLEMVHQRFVSVATEKHSHLSEEENAVLYEYLKHSVEDEYDRVSKKVMGRKGLHRELSSDEAVYSVEKAIKGWLRHWAGKIWSLVKILFGF